MSKNDGGSADYYQLPDGARELQDLIEHKSMNFAVGNIFKAAYRLGAENSLSDRARDLRKIMWFAQRELAYIESNTEPPNPARTKYDCDHYLRIEDTCDSYGKGFRCSGCVTFTRIARKSAEHPPTGI